MLQRKCSCGGNKNDAPSIVHEALRTPGQPLDAQTREFFEPRFAHDFTRVAASQVPQKLAVGEAGDAHEREADRFASSIAHRAPAAAHGDLSPVRIHDDERAAESARAVGARAYTVGHHIVFGGGEYSPRTSAGRQLLAHELAHVGQQSEGKVARTLQRSLTVVDPTVAAQHQPAGRAAGATPLTNAQLVQQWINSMCASGGWTVDATSGALSTPNRAAFCGPAAAGAQPGFATSGTPVSCGCLCDITAPSAPVVRLHAGDIMTTPGETAGSTLRTDVRPEGQGATLFPRGTRTETHVGVSGREGTGITGAGATSPRGGSARSQNLPDPPWLIFAHEVCGHVLIPSTASPFFGGSHAQSPSGTESAVDIENRIRREHSTTTSSLGIRMGEQHVETAANPLVTERAFGAHYTVVAGDTLQSVATRFGISSRRITNTIFMGEGGRFRSASDPIHDNTLFIRGLAYHQVISGETLASIARIWGISEAALRRANPSLGATAQPTVGTRLFIPIS